MKVLGYLVVKLTLSCTLLMIDGVFIYFFCFLFPFPQFFNACVSIANKIYHIQSMYTSLNSLNECTVTNDSLGMN